MIGAITRRLLLQKTAAVATVAAPLSGSISDGSAMLPHMREGCGAVVLNGNLVLFDTTDWRQIEGAEALVIHRDRMVVETIVEATPPTTYVGRAGSVAEPSTDSRFSVQATVNVIGRVLSIIPRGAA